MTDDQNTLDDELFDIEEDEGDADAETNTEEDNKEVLNGEEALGLELESGHKEAKKTAAELQRDKQVEVWTTRVINGEADIDNLPKNLQWMKKYIEDKLTTPPQNSEDAIASLLEKKWQEKEEAKRFESLKSDIAMMGLDRSQREQLQAEYKDLAQSGLPKAKALEKALMIVGVSKQAVETKALRQRMGIPTGRRVNTVGEGAIYDPSLPEEQRLKNLIKIANEAERSRG